MIRLPVTKDGTTGSTSFFQYKQKGEDINGFNSIKRSLKELSTLPLVNEGGITSFKNHHVHCKTRKVSLKIELPQQYKAVV